MDFEFATATRIIFGPGKLAVLGEICSDLGRRPLVASNFPENSEKIALIRQSLPANLQDFFFYQQVGEPTTHSIQAGVDLARTHACDVVIGFGGGSAIDSGKSIAALAANPGPLTDYLEVIGSGRKLSNPSLPLIAVPTTAGTGSEVTRNAVIGSPENRLKVSLRGPQLLARAAIVDPELTYSLPPEITASTGMDALTQLIEPFVSNAANPLTDALCREGIFRSVRSLVGVFKDPQDEPGRMDLSLASLFGGLALANARLGAVHGFAGVIGGMYAAPHGVICGRLLPVVVEMNYRALSSRSPRHPALARYREIAALVTGKPDSSIYSAVDWLYWLRQALKIPALRDYGVQPGDLDQIIRQAQSASSMKGNPVELSNDELRLILEQAI